MPAKFYRNFGSLQGGDSSERMCSGSKAMAYAACTCPHCEARKEKRDVRTEQMARLGVYLAARVASEKPVTRELSDAEINSIPSYSDPKANREKLGDLLKRSAPGSRAPKVNARKNQNAEKK